MSSPSIRNCPEFAGATVSVSPSTRVTRTERTRDKGSADTAFHDSPRTKT